MLKRLSAVILAGGLAVACVETPMPTGITESPDIGASQSILSELTCRVDAAKSTMSCEPPKPLSVAGRSSDLILGGQNTYVKLTSSGVVANASTVTANVTVQNLTVQPWSTTDGTTPDPTGVRIFFAQGPSGVVTVVNATGTFYFTNSNQPYFQYSGADLDLDGTSGILARNETSRSLTWQFDLNGGPGTFTFTVYISTKMPSELGVLRWTSSTLGKTQVQELKNAVWGSSASDVWAGGTGGATALHHWNGASWSAVPSANSTDVVGLWGSASNNVYAVGDVEIQRWNGTAWADVASSPVSVLFAVWGSSANDVYAGGLNGTLVRSTGGAFSAVPNTGLGTESVAAIWGTGPNDVYTGGSTLRHWDGFNWSSTTAGITNIGAIWGSSASDIWVGGANGQVQHLVGGVWTTVTGFGSGHVSGIWGTGANDVFLVNRFGDIFHYNGTSWLKHSLTGTGLTAVWGSGTSDVWAVGSNSPAFAENVVVHGTR
jgi:hypothetical protein